MKIGLIIPNNRWFCPYVDIYSRILDDLHEQYDIISWCRDGNEEKGCVQYYGNNAYRNPLLKFIPYLRFAKFVKKTIKKGHYDKLIVFTPQVGIFIAGFLKRYYKGNYIIDYRDLSLEQKALFKKPFNKVLSNSFANVISSPGFKKYLPSKFNYVLSHNFNIEAVRKSLSGNQSIGLKVPNVIDILTIGGIRDFESNVKVMHAIGNKEGFRLRFIGRGPSADLIKKVSDENNYKNVDFVGYYPKEDEPKYIETATFLNIFYPRKASHDTALSNRFYNSLIYRKPMIVTADTTQGDYAAKYGVGVALENCDNLTTKLRNYLKSYEYQHFTENADRLLLSFIKDYEKFHTILISFLKS